MKNFLLLHIRESILKEEEGFALLRFIFECVYRDVLNMAYNPYIRPHLMAVSYISDTTRPWKFKNGQFQKIVPTSLAVHKCRENVLETSWNLRPKMGG